MTIDDLNEYGITQNGKINDKDLGLLILKYNEMYLTDEEEKSKFKKLVEKVFNKLNCGDSDE